MKGNEALIELKNRWNRKDDYIMWLIYSVLKNSNPWKNEVYQISELLISLEREEENSRLNDEPKNCTLGADDLGNNEGDGDTE